MMANSLLRAGCCCGAPCECPCTHEQWIDLASAGTPCGGLVKCYEINGYSDGDLDADGAGCSASGNPAWDGSVDAAYWDQDCHWGSAPTKSIDGCALQYAHLYLDTANCKWLFEVLCSGCGSPPCIVWKGEKTTGSTPVGTYTRTAGNDTTTSLQIAEKSC